MDIIFAACIPHDLEMTAIKKIAETLRMHQMQNNIPNATIIICETPTKEQTMTVQELAEILVKETIEEVNELNIQKFVIPPRVEIEPAPEIPDENQKNKHRQNLLRQSMKRFNIVNQYRKQILFNRTQHK